MTELLHVVTSSTAAAPDPFDLERLALPQDFAATAQLKEPLLTIPVRRPGKQEFVRVRADAGYQADFSFIHLEEENELYVVVPELRRQLAAELVFMTLFTAISAQGVLFLWPVRLPDPEGRGEEWRRSQREAAELATKKWLRMKSNRALGAYTIAVAEGMTAEPTWPPETFAQMIRIAFRDRLIDRPDHAVIKRLQGRS
jgi:hypothetical protein